MSAARLFWPLKLREVRVPNACNLTASMPGLIFSTLGNGSLKRIRSASAFN